MNVRANYILTQNKHSQFELLHDRYLEIDTNGKIVSVSDYTSQDVETHFKHLIIPGLTNAHSHGFQLMMRGKADNPKNFRDWVNTYLYPSVESLNEISLRKTLAHLFRLMLKNGITTLGEFHYFHHDHPRDFEFDRIMLEEAQKSGIRLSLLSSAYDLGSREAQKRFHSSPDEFITSLESINKWLEENNLSDQWSLSVAPHSLHGCSPELLKAAVKWALDRDLKWHIHLSEQQEDIPFSNEKFGTTPLHALHTILEDQLDHRACLVHGCWLTESELKLFNEKHINLIYNPFTNMYLGDGITPTIEMDFNTSKIALGTDSNNAFNMFTEAKLFESLQRVKKLEMGIINSHQLFSSITSFGGELLNLPVGKLVEGYFADFIEIDLETVVQKTIPEMNVDELINHLIFSGVDSSDIISRYIGGKLVSV